MDAANRDPARIVRAFDCRNNRLALLALEHDGFLAAVAAARQRLGAARIALFLGTSTSGILSTELAYQGRDPATGSLPEAFRYDTMHNLDATTEFVRRVLGLTGPAMTISTACSSSAKVFCLAERFMRLGGRCRGSRRVDSLCHTTLYGFSALQLVAPDICRPFDTARRGITIGEAAGFALLERGSGALTLMGYGETSDAYHMSTPHPEGDGARRAMLDALARARLSAQEIDYVNLHGTATPANDRAEGKAVHEVFGTPRRALPPGRHRAHAGRRHHRGGNLVLASRKAHAGQPDHARLIRDAGTIERASRASSRALYNSFASAAATARGVGKAADAHRDRSGGVPTGLPFWTARRRLRGRHTFLAAPLAPFAPSILSPSTAAQLAHVAWRSPRPSSVAAHTIARRTWPWCFASPSSAASSPTSCAKLAGS